MEDFFHTADNANDRNLKNLKVFFFLLIFCEVYGPQPTRTFQETLQELRILTCHGNSNLLFNSPCLFSNIVSSFPLQCTSCPRGGGSHLSWSLHRPPARTQAPPHYPISPTACIPALKHCFCHIALFCSPGGTEVLLPFISFFFCTDLHY